MSKPSSSFIVTVLAVIAVGARLQEGMRVFDLIAEGPQPQHRWRKKIRDADWHLIGRQAGVFCVDWDTQISRQHAQFRQVRGGVEVEKLPVATNPVFFEGSPVERFRLRANQHFVIGQTRFTVALSEAMVTMEVPSPIHQKTFSDQFLHGLAYRDANLRLNVLNRLPELIAGAASEEQLLDRLASVLLEGVPQAEVVAIVNLAESSDLEIKHWDSRQPWDVPFQPSASLIRQALDSADTVLHVWSDGSQKVADYTLQQHADWAFVCPLKGSVCGGQAIYVSGRVGRLGSTLTSEALLDDLKFTQLVTSTYGNVLELESLQRRQAALRSFFSPVVVEALAGRNPDRVLEPRPCRLSVLFCDLRGFSATSERMSDNLLELLNRVSRALGVMTSNILAERGVVGDFHGDAVMGFWGWPLDQEDAVPRAIQTALSISEQFEHLYDSVDYPVSQFMMGLGIASGTAVAGRIGTSDQVKVTAFGPVVNLASRLEGMTRYFKVPILCDENTAQQWQAAADRPGCRIRHLATVIPHGFRKSTDVYQIIPPGPLFDPITDQHLEIYARAWQDVHAGHWREAAAMLDQLPAADLGKNFVADYLQQHNFVPPADWQGAIVIPGK